MTDYYKTNKEALREVTEKYNKLKSKIKAEIKRHRALGEVVESENYSLAHSMTADFLEELTTEFK